MRTGWWLGGVTAFLVVAAVGWGWVCESRPTDRPNAGVLLRLEALRGAGRPPLDDWKHCREEAIPVLSRTLERRDSRWGEWLRHHWDSVALRMGRGNWRHPSGFEMRSAAARVAVALGPGAHDLIPGLILAQEREPDVEDVTLALMQFGPAASNAVPLLVRQLEEERFRDSVARALLAIGAPGDVWDRFQGDRRSRARLIGRVGELMSQGRTNGALEVLIESIPNPETRPLAGRILGDLGPVAAPLSMRLARELESEDAGLRAFSAGMLGRMGPAAAPALEALMACLDREEDPQVRLTVIRTLGRIGPAARPALPRLEAFRQGSDEEQIREAREAAERIDR